MCDACAVDVSLVEAGWVWFFFFSSRRRHTRWPRDWSSDVCSSDLYSAAEAQARIGEAATGIGGKMADAGAAIERARAKTEEMQARAGAMDELIASGTLEDFTSDKTQLDRELAQMASQSQVESDLAKLKQDVGSGDEQKQLEGATDAPPIHAVPSEEDADSRHA